MTAILDHPSTGHPTGAAVNARGEEVFLRAAGYTLTARQLVLVLANHLARFGDTLAVKVVDPLAAIDAVMRFDLAGRTTDLTGWTTGRAPADVATVRARAEAIARDYFGTYFPVVAW